MDRLVCGDVGYGKTEVAMRAAMRAVLDGKQVAVLAPTTVLAFQHWKTFRKRFAPFPVTVEMVSRFRTPKEIKAVLARVAAGGVDVLIGTHRILSKDVVFRDLGLLVVDEEQRFGVAAKEKLKQLKTTVDVPDAVRDADPAHAADGPRRDPRHVGHRDPAARPARDPDLDREVLDRRDRGRDPPGARPARARSSSSTTGSSRSTPWRASCSAWCRRRASWSRHGQMPEAELERVMLAFVEGRADVLVATTIVENGLDIPRANTLVVNRADRYGLAQLYQLRGRVGRSDRRAFAYLLVPPDTVLSEIARKRLAAIREFSDLGAGFRIAALDLELRGAGNLLGGQQSGHIQAVGLDLYVKLLEQAILELRGEPSREAPRAALHLRRGDAHPARLRAGDAPAAARSTRGSASCGGRRRSSRCAPSCATATGRPRPRWRGCSATRSCASAPEALAVDPGGRDRRRARRPLRRADAAPGRRPRPGRRASGRGPRCMPDGLRWPLGGRGAARRARRPARSPAGRAMIRAAMLLAAASSPRSSPRALGLAACEGKDPVILRLDGESVRRSDFERYVAAVEARAQGPLDPTARRGCSRPSSRSGRS